MNVLSTVSPLDGGLPMIVALTVGLLTFVGLLLRLLFSRGPNGESRTQLLHDKRGRKEAADDLNDYVDYYENGVRSSRVVPQKVEKFYNLVTDFYTYGWGQSFHFCQQMKHETFKEAIVRHEKRIADDLAIKAGDKVLDAGCGVAGPLRNIARMTGAHITGVTICEYQVKRANEYIEKDGFAETCRVQQANFLALPFAENTFDHIFAIEASCHAPKLEEMYAEAYRVLRPGGKFAVYEWVTTDKYDHENAVDRELIAAINLGNGLPDMRRRVDIGAAARSVGFNVVLEKDLVDDAEIPWWNPLKRGRISFHVTHFMCKVLEWVRWAPRGTVGVSSLLMRTAADLSAAGERGIFTPMYYCVFQKPVNAQ